MPYSVLQFIAFLPVREKGKGTHQISDALSWDLTVTFPGGKTYLNSLLFNDAEYYLLP